MKRGLDFKKKVNICAIYQGPPTPTSFVYQMQPPPPLNNPWLIPLCLRMNVGKDVRDAGPAGLSVWCNLSPLICLQERKKIIMVFRHFQT